LNEEAPLDVMIGTEDGDIELAAILSYHTRRALRPNGQRAGRVYIRRSQIIAYTATENGIKSPVKQPEWISVDHIAEYLDMVLGGLLADRMVTSDDHEDYGRCEPLAVYCLLALMCKNDYSEGFRGLSAVNILRGIMSRPDLARRTVRVLCAPRHQENGNKRALHLATAPDTCLLSAGHMRRFVSHCYSEAHNNRVSPKTYPVPPDATIDAVTARISWTIDKLWNAGRPGYQIANPFLLDQRSELAVYGYALDDDEDGSKKKRARFTPQVDERLVYGVAHPKN
jgi:hypothetical protein